MARDRWLLGNGWAIPHYTWEFVRDHPETVADEVRLGDTLAPDDDQLFTWWAPWRNLRQRNIGWRLDYVLASHSLFQRVHSCVVHREVGTSDHAPVVAVFG